MREITKTISSHADGKPADFRLTKLDAFNSRVSLSAGAVYFTITADASVMRVNRNFPDRDGQIGFFIIIACKDDLPDGILRIVSCIKGSLRIIMHKDFRCGKILIHQKFQRDPPCFIQTDGLIVRNSDSPSVMADIFIFDILVFDGISVRKKTDITLVLDFRTLLIGIETYGCSL